MELTGQCKDANLLGVGSSLLMGVKSQHHTHTLQTEASSPVRGGSHDGSTAANVPVVFSSRVDVRGGGHEVAERGSI